MGLDEFKLDGGVFKESLSKARILAGATVLAILTTLNGCGNQDITSENCTSTQRRVIVSKNPDDAMQNPIKIQNKVTGEVLYIAKTDWKTIIGCMESDQGVLVEGSNNDWNEQIQISSQGWQALYNGAYIHSGGARYYPIDIYNTGGTTYITSKGGNGSDEITTFGNKGIGYHGASESEISAHRNGSGEYGISKWLHGSIGKVGAHGVG